MENMGDMKPSLLGFLPSTEDYSWGGLKENVSGLRFKLPGRSQSATASKNIVSERNRRKKLNDRLFALRAVVPNITKVRPSAIDFTHKLEYLFSDGQGINIKDAIDYIRKLHDQEQAIRSELILLESQKLEPEIWIAIQNTDTESLCPCKIKSAFGPSGSWVFPLKFLM
ncbi:hypothetical protein R6Q59_032989 [Mikania micrantha]